MHGVNSMFVCERGGMVDALSSGGSELMLVRVQVPPLALFPSFPSSDFTVFFQCFQRFSRHIEVHNESSSFTRFAGKRWARSTARLLNAKIARLCPSAQGRQSRGISQEGRPDALARNSFQPAPANGDQIGIALQVSQAPMHTPARRMHDSAFHPTRRVMRPRNRPCLRPPQISTNAHTPAAYARMTFQYGPKPLIATMYP